MPKRTCARICLTDVSCRLNTRKATSKSRLSDEMLDVWVKARPNEVDTEAAVTLEVGQDLLFIFTTEVDADGSKPDRHFHGHAAENSIARDEIAMEVFGVSKERQCQKSRCKSTCPWFVFLSIVAPTQMKSSTSVALFTGCGSEARQDSLQQVRTKRSVTIQKQY